MTGTENKKVEELQKLVRDYFVDYLTAKDKENQTEMYTCDVVDFSADICDMIKDVMEEK